MILDQIFHGVLNESVGTLEVYDEPTDDVSFIVPLRVPEADGSSRCTVLLWIR